MCSLFGQAKRASSAPKSFGAVESQFRSCTVLVHPRGEVPQKYLKLLSLSVPNVADAVFRRREEFLQFVGNLSLVAGRYNTIRQTLLDVEKPLVQDRLAKVSALLEAGVNTLAWNSKDILELISSARANVRDLYVRVNHLKGNVWTIETILEGWKDSSPF